MRLRVPSGWGSIWPRSRSISTSMAPSTGAADGPNADAPRAQVVVPVRILDYFRNVEHHQPAQIITSLPQILAALDTIHALAGSEKLIVAGHDPEVAHYGRIGSLLPRFLAY